MGNSRRLELHVGSDGGEERWGYASPCGADLEAQVLHPLPPYTHLRNLRNSGQSFGGRPKVQVIGGL